MKHKKLKWDKVSSCFDLKLKNYKDVDTKKLRKLLENAERNYPDYRKPFSKKASELFERWFNETEQPLPGAAYALLSNWFLTGSSASKKTRAQHTLNLWNALFCKIPERRLTNPKRNYKILKEEFDLWWPIQLKCQESNKTI